MAESRSTAERVLVVGAGVIGLTCAVLLAEDGFEVHVLARDLPLETTSSIAAALWYPYRAGPAERVLAWSAMSYRDFVHLAETVPGCGVRVRRGRELLRERSGDPWWRGAVPAVDHLGDSELPAGFAAGWGTSLPVIDMSRYLPWLTARLEAAGGLITRISLSELPTNAPLVVNASGLSARSLADDQSVVPVRGQLLRVTPCGIEEWTLDSQDPERPVYVVPRTDDVVVGGTAQEGAWDTVPDPEIAAEVLRRAVALVPELGRAQVLGHRAGLRPARPRVRLDAERRGEQHVVHCYGHGGAGVTLSWGCAVEVLTAVREHASGAG